MIVVATPLFVLMKRNASATSAPARAARAATAFIPIRTCTRPVLHRLAAAGPSWVFARHALASAATGRVRLARASAPVGTPLGSMRGCAARTKAQATNTERTDSSRVRDTLHLPVGCVAYYRRSEKRSIVSRSLARLNVYTSDWLRYNGCPVSVARHPRRTAGAPNLSRPRAG